MDLVAANSEAVELESTQRAHPIERKTQFSPCRQYRYTLWRDWDFPALPLGAPEDGFDGFKQLKDAGEYAMFIGLNPSTADETKDDPTIRKCIGFAKRWGYGALCMTNLFAFRATDPKVMKHEENPVGRANLRCLQEYAAKAGIVVAAWGVNGRHMAMDKIVRQWLSDAGVKLYCLRMTASGFPEHPLYVPYGDAIPFD